MFLIAGAYLYDEEKNVIWNQSADSEKITVPPTAARLLELFLEKQGIVLSRDEILKTIWERYGLSPSNNTLNQYISLLRKIFEKLGFEQEVIKTIPRAGFLLVDDISVEYTRQVTNAQSKPEKKSRFFIPSIIITVLIMIVIFLMPGRFTNRTDAELYFLGKINQCPVYMLYKNSEETTTKKIKVAEKLINGLIPCQGDDIYIYHPSDSLILTGDGSAFISRCTLQKENETQFAGCYDVYKFEKN